MLLIVTAGMYLLIALPAYTVAQRTGVEKPWIALIPGLGVWIVLFWSMKRSGWLSLLVFVPYVGFLVPLVWVSVEIASTHGRSNWWIAAFLTPGVNFVAYYAYAFTLETEPRERLVFAT
jgi:hypothetical protein